MIEDAEPTGVLTMPTAEAPYRRIANEIAAKIKSGELQPGDKLPSTRELAETYAVHMNTASRALSLLHDRELITGQPGRGTYVAEHPGR
ncbi:GntR family transcriptional regulator [Micromonospora sp. CA-269861]|uniref:GntR family transcriptional regulator n=1 Tax=Micromonospora sp. CA-269861 TaxID=3239968 RepID=UPI003D934129